MPNFDNAWTEIIGRDEDTCEEMYGFALREIPDLTVSIFPRHDGQTWNNNDIWKPGYSSNPITTVLVVISTSCEIADVDCDCTVSLSNNEFTPPNDNKPHTNEEIIALAKRYALLHTAQYFQQRAQACLDLYKSYGLTS